jgi:hypothetical protein
MKTVITQLVKQKKKLKKKLNKNKKTKPPVSTSLTLKKPNPFTLKSKATVKEILTLKIPFYIKFNQIQIENIEKENFNTPTPRQGDIIAKKVKEIIIIDLNTLTPRQSDISNSPNISTFPTLDLISQISFIVNENLSKIDTLP